MTYGIRSPYCGSSFGSINTRRAATATPGGGGNASLEDLQGKEAKGNRTPVRTYMFPF